MKFFQAGRSSCLGHEMQGRIPSAAPFTPRPTSLGRFSAPPSWFGARAQPVEPRGCREGKQALGGVVWDKYACWLLPRGLAPPFTLTVALQIPPAAPRRELANGQHLPRGLFLWYFSSLKKLSVVPRRPRGRGGFFSWNLIWGQFQQLSGSS